MKINSTVYRFLDQTIRAFEDALETGELLSFRVIRRRKYFFTYFFLLQFMNHNILRI